jgi:hypothetical protein
MARGAKEAVRGPKPEFNEVALRDVSATLDKRAAQLAPIDSKFGGGLAYQKERIEAEAAFFINQGSESFFEAGKRLILLKEHEAQGEFYKALDRIGIDDRAARKLMAVSARFADTKFAAFPRSKLLELAVLDDEELESFDTDDVGRMGVRELRGQVRKLREQRDEDNEANERLLEAKDKKLNEFAKRSFEPWDERMSGLASELHTCSIAASECLTHVFSVAKAATVWKIDRDEEMYQKNEIAVRIISDVNLLVERVAAIQAFVYEHFLPYTNDGAVPQLSDPIPPGKGGRS